MNLILGIMRNKEHSLRNFSFIGKSLNNHRELLNKTKVIILKIRKSGMGKKLMH